DRRARGWFRSRAPRGCSGVPATPPLHSPLPSATATAVARRWRRGGRACGQRAGPSGECSDTLFSWGRIGRSRPAAMLAGMLALIQRVTHARVSVDGEVVGAIGAGLLALVGVEPDDGQQQVDR